MRPLLTSLLILGTIAGFGAAQNCPILGPAYPAPNNVSSSAFASAKAAFDEALTRAHSHGRIPSNTTFYSIQVYSPASRNLIHSVYYTATNKTVSRKPVTVGPDTIFRIFSLSKLLTVYTILTKLGDKYWNEPVSKYVPELAAAQNRRQNAIDDVDWDEVTLGSLSSLMSGIARDCIFPFTSTYNTPNYSNMAFQILAYAVENITGQPFAELVRTQLVEPLNLTRTFLTNPEQHTKLSDAVITEGWDWDLGDESPTGGYYSTISDLTTLGTSILNSTLLPAKATRKWLKPLTHTGSLLTSIGRPWEILRRAIPFPSRPRIADVYTKQGGSDTYVSFLALSPDHNIGISILTASAGKSDAFDVIKKLSLDIWIPAAEQAARDQAGGDFVGRYTLGGGGNASASAEIQLLPGQPGLYVHSLVSEGVDFFGLIQSLLGREGELKAWLYPIGLVSEKGGKKKVAFRAVFGVLGVEAEEDCATWAQVDSGRFGGHPKDLFIFEVDEGGRATGLEVPILGKVLGKVGQ
ncbi:beta-lactamase/transpeptidase-like protein [Lasiosphaeria hispida]|uniref:Beta-lactamase/transpeptidase-like protein n=1 Tax=Lasiosphaeria hispida TaxID=260671 RepID=A0AAJ0HSR3_9PEZI|nr:beta-lactamase/transpeptidase-like protein [Lasiosphaeria hispida]